MAKKKRILAAARPSKPKATKAKPQTKKTTLKTTSGAKKKYEKPLVLIPVLIKDHNDKNGGHHHVIVDNIDKNHISVGLTTKKKKGKNSTNYSCKVDPLGSGVDSYMRRQAQVAPKSEYFKPQNGAMEKGDFEQAKIYAERAKQKYLQKKSKKK